MSSGSKKGDKRSRASMEENNSFVKSVTSKVSSFLPATITRWLSPSTSNSNGSTPAADATDSSTEDEAPEPVIQPPAKRIRYNPTDFNHFTTTEITCINTTSVDTVDTKFTTSTQEKPNNKKSFPSKFSRMGIPVRKSIFNTSNKESPKSTQAKSPPDDDSQYRKSAHKPIMLSSPFYPGQTMYGGAASPHLNHANIKQRRNTLVNESKSKDNTGMSHSARRIMELLENSGTPLMEAKRISQYVKHTSSNTLTHNSTTSVSPIKYTPYVPPTLSYKTKELQLPNVASIIQLKQRSRLMDTTNAARQIIASHSSTAPYMPYATDKKREETAQESRGTFVTKMKTKLNGPKRASKEPEYSYNAPLNLPTGVLQIGKNNMPTFTFTTTQPNNNTSITTSSIMKESSSNEQELNISTGQDSDPKFKEYGLKPTTSVFESTKELELCKPKEVDGSEPKSKDFGIRMPTPPMSNSWTISKPMLTENDNSQTISKAATIDSGLSSFETLPSNDPYKFSSPVRISTDAGLSNSKSAQFTFGSPERSIDSIKNNKNFATDLDPQSMCTQRQCSSCKSLNDGDIKKCAQCDSSATPPKDTMNKPKCSTCKLVDSQTDKDKCLNCEMKTIKGSSSKWKCQDCWVENNLSVEKCVCCGANNSNKSDVTKKSTSINKANIASTETDWKCDSCWIKNKKNTESCVACGEPKPGTKENSSSLWAKSTFGSIKCSNTNNLLVKTAGVQSDKWNCPTCLVSNENSNSKCVCCGYDKQSSFKESSNLNNLIKTQSEKWECLSCLVRNENSKTKCVCCESEKPGSVKQQEKQSNQNLKAVNKAQFNNWECPSCLVKNDNNRSKCVCCETEKPGTTSEAAKLSFNFGVNQNNTFKFGIDPKVQEMQLSKKTDVAETNNNVIPKTPSFTFGIPAKKEEIGTCITKETENKETPKINFTFGIPKPQATETVATPIFTSNKLPEVVPNNIIEVKENPQEVPKIDFILPKPNETLKPLPAIFGSQLNSQSNQGLSIAAPPQLIPAVTTESAKISSTPLMLQPTLTSAQVTQPPNIFAFSSGLKPAVNLFAVPATTLSFTSPVQTTVAASPTSLFNKQEITAPSLFQKTETVTTSTVSLFDKSSTITTATLPSMTATAPVFSFGTNGPQNAIAQPEKPKFNFTFGGVNPLFSNNTFGASTDVNTNKFDMSGGSINTGNSGLSVGGPMGGNGLPTNKLGSNELSTNHTPAVAESQTAGSGLFAAPVQKENLWLSATSNTSNSFVSTSSASLPKPAFNFGSTMQFNANSTPAFGGNQMMFGGNQMMNQSSNNTSMFSTPVHNQTAPNLFGNPQPTNNSAPAIGMFGSPNVAAAPTFGSPRPAFETSITPTPTPAFNFSASQPTGVFGMVQQQPQPQPGQQPGMYNFAVPSGGAPQFNIGSAPNTAVRRVRKAVRRNNQR